MSERTWKVGDVAKATGLTVRTLHHYDEIGLLRPSERGDGSAHRLYSEGDIRRLQRIVALRGLGMPLREVAETLEQDGDDPRLALRAQLERLDHQLSLAAKLRRRLDRILSALDVGESPSIDDVMTAIEETMRMEQYYTPEQLAKLAQRREELGSAGMERAQREWAQAIEDMEAERRAGTDPADARVQTIVARWRALIEQFTGGDAGIRDALGRMYDAEGAEKPSRGMVNEELASYVREAMGAAG